MLKPTMVNLLCMNEQRTLVSVIDFIPYNDNKSLFLTPYFV